MRKRAAAVVLVAAATGACGGSSASGEDDTTLTVYAAASLTTSFEELADRFEDDHPGVDVQLNFAGSSDLVAQIRSGAPADVLASADERTMDDLVADGLTAAEPAVFATNTLRIATPPDNPAGVRSLADLADPETTVVVCAPEVPCGAAARALADTAGVVLSPDSEEQSVTDVLGKVTSGEADAGLVYVTDVLAAGDAARGIDVPEAAEVVNAYPITTVSGSRHPDLAEEFVELVLGEEGRQVLGDAGFDPP